MLNLSLLVNRVNERSESERERAGEVRERERKDSIDVDLVRDFWTILFIYKRNNWIKKNFLFSK